MRPAVVTGIDSVGGRKKTTGAQKGPFRFSSVRLCSNSRKVCPVVATRRGEPRERDQETRFEADDSTMGVSRACQLTPRSRTLRVCVSECVRVVCVCVCVVKRALTVSVNVLHMFRYSSIQLRPRFCLTLGLCLAEQYLSLV